MGGAWFDSPMSDSPLRLLPAPVTALPSPDAGQAALLAAVERGHAAVVLAPPGSGRSTAGLLLAVAQARAGGRVDVLAPSRARADQLRDRLAAHLAHRDGALAARITVRTPVAYALAALRTWAVERDDPYTPPALLTGPRADHLLAELLAADHGPWPAAVPTATRQLPEFRAELRNLFDAVGSVGWSATDLAAAAARYGVAAWQGCARILARYDARAQVGRPTPGRTIELDHVRACTRAAQLLTEWQDLARGQAVRAAVPVPDVLIIDDAQDLTPAAASLVETSAALGARLVLLGDPDQCVESFRGADPRWLGSWARRARAADPTVIGRGGVKAPVRIGLPHRYRADLPLWAAVDRVAALTPLEGDAARRGAAARGQAEPATQPTGAGRVGDDAGLAVGSRPAAVSRVEARLLAASHVLPQAVAHRLRARHVRDGVDWADCVVIVRSAAAAHRLARDLVALGVPVVPPAERTPLAANPVVAMLLELAGLAARQETIDSATVIRLARSALVGLDSLTERRARRWLPAELTDAEALVTLASGTAELPADLPGREAWVRLRAILAATAASAALGPREALWEIWQAAGVAERWQAEVLQATGAGTAERLAVAARERDLDAVVALLRRADLWVQARPGGTTAALVRELQSDTVAMDSLARSAQLPPSVEVLTPAGAVGRSWDTVIVAELAEGQWPNPRVRDTFLQAGLVRALARAQTPVGAEALPQSVAENIADEARLLVAAASRATRLLVAYGYDGEAGGASRFLPVLAGGQVADEAALAAETSGSLRPVDVSLPHYAAALRRALLSDWRPASPEGDPPPAVPDARAQLLALLARAGVPGAEPAQWRALNTPTTSAGLRAPGPGVTVSPSAVEWALKCPARWALTSHGGQVGTSTAQTTGTLIHQFAEDYPTAAQAHDLRAALATWSAAQEPQGLEESRTVAQVLAMGELLADYIESIPGPVLAEQRLRFTVGDVTVSGRLDRVEILDDGVVRVVDFKTGAKDTDHAVVQDNGRRDLARLVGNPQLGLYQYGIARGGLVGQRAVTECTDARLVNLRDPIRGRARVQNQAPLTDPQWVEDLLREVGALLRGAQFPALPGEHCRSCPVKTSCPAQGEGRRIR